MQIKKDERTFAIDPGHYPDLWWYGFNYQTRQYIHGVRMTQAVAISGVSKASLYHSAAFKGRPMKNGWAFSYTYRKDWEHLSMQEVPISDKVADFLKRSISL